MTQHLFISGVPCTGKSLLGSWLAKEQGYIHIDAERDNGRDLDEAGIHREWDEIFATGHAAKFLSASNRLNKPIVIDWGFRMSDIYVVSALEAEGVECWWLDAKPDQARNAFVARGGIPVECFDRQMVAIDRYRALIERVFRDHIVAGLNPDGAQRKPDELWAEIVGGATK